VEKQDKLINTMHETAMATASNYAWEFNIGTGEYYFEDDEGEQVLLTDVLKTIYNSSIYNWSARTSSFRTSREFIINLGDENNNETKCNWYE
jgi:nitroimidazol reductase NimA-like FMN-containing flavoprotein (pyridoxamine 5'-phosphate oxidase superfamily)